MNSKHAQLIAIVRLQCPEVQTIANKTDSCLLCKCDLSSIPLSSRLLLLDGSKHVNAGAACEPCWEKFRKANAIDITYSNGKALQ